MNELLNVSSNMKLTYENVTLQLRAVLFSWAIYEITFDSQFSLGVFCLYSVIAFSGTCFCNLICAIKAMHFPVMTLMESGYWIPVYIFVVNRV